VEQIRAKDVRCSVIHVPTLRPTREAAADGRRKRQETRSLNSDTGRPWGSKKEVSRFNKSLNFTQVDKRTFQCDIQTVPHSGKVYESS